MPTLEVNEPKKELSPQKKAALAVLAVLASGGIFWGLWQWRLDVDTANYKQAIADDQKYRSDKMPEKAVAEWEKYRSGVSPKQYIYQADLYEGAVLESMNDYTGALKIYHDAEAHRQGTGTGEVEGIARISERSGDYATALTYYAKVEELYAKKSAHGPEAAWTKRHIAELKILAAKNAVK
ncbi:MAG: hypothetical protein NVSMB39_3810 [Candidatus Saccharimonadales bacterium]